MSIEHNQDDHKNNLVQEGERQETNNLPANEINLSYPPANPIYFPGTSIYDDYDMETHNGKLYPHWELQHVVYHASFRLADSVPMDKQREWLAERKQIQDICKKEQRTLREDEMKRLQHLYSDKIEHFLDVGYGSCVLQKPKVAEIVRGSLEYYNKIKYLLHAWCIMPNHVHVIFQILAGHTLSKILQGWKSFTSHAINKNLGTQGQLWQSDCYNHIIRSEKEYYQQIRYVWDNPLKAGHPKWKWRWKCLED